VLALARETHVKQLDFSCLRRQTPESPSGVWSSTSVPSYRSNLWLNRTVAGLPRIALCAPFLETAFGSEAHTTMHRLTVAGPVSANLDSELSEMEGLFAGAATTADIQLGMELARASRWIGNRSGCGCRALSGLGRQLAAR
jgi:hypothetical protein